jgi:hypothetical protein
VYRHVIAELPDGIEVVEHRVRAVRLAGDAPQEVWMDGEPEPLRVDAVLLTVGHLDADPDELESELLRFADRHGLAYPAGYTADVDYSGVRPGEEVLVRGFGLAFMI